MSIHIYCNIYTGCLKIYTLSDNMCLIHISAIVMLTVMCADRMYYTDLKVACDIIMITVVVVGPTSMCGAYWTLVICRN